LENEIVFLGDDSILVIEHTHYLCIVIPPGAPFKQLIN
jgi:hypothetical protein